MVFCPFVSNLLQLDFMEYFLFICLFIYSFLCIFFSFFLFIFWILVIFFISKQDQCTRVFSSEVLAIFPRHCEHPLRFCKKVVIVLRTWVHHRIVARQ